MDIVLHKNGPLGLKDQIKRQIRVMVEGGELRPGQILPSAKDLAKGLNVNRNTVAAAYREMVAEGLLTSVVGSGTFVREDAVKSPTQTLRTIVDEAFGKAVASGFSPDQITDFVLNRVTTYFGTTGGARVLVVECSQEACDDISGTLERQLSVETTRLLIDQLEEHPLIASEYLSDVDLVVCGFNHVEQFRRAVHGTSIDTVAVMRKTDVRIMNELMQLPMGTKVGLACANRRSTETLSQEDMFTCGTSFIKMWPGEGNPAVLRKLVDQCHVIFATSYVYDHILSIAGPDTRVIKVDMSIDQANIDLIRERLILARARRPPHGASYDHEVGTAEGDRTWI